MAHEGFWHADIRPTQQWPATAHLFSHSVEARTMAEEKSAIIIMRRRTSKGPGMATETCMSNTVLRVVLKGKLRNRCVLQCTYFKSRGARDGAHSCAIHRKTWLSASAVRHALLLARRL